MKNNKLLFFMVAGFSLLMTSTASMGLGGEGLNIAQFCNTPSPRQTLIYIDEKILVKEQAQWAKDLLAKLSGNLMPSEPVTLIKLSAETGAAQQLWQGCYPEYSAQQRTLIANKHSGIIAGVFSSNPVDALPQQKAIFQSQIGGALGQLLQQSGRDLSSVQVNPADLSNKQIILALANDSPRFDPTHGVIRAIIYSDMLEHSGLGSSLTSNPATAASAATERALNFKNAVFYIYGAGSTLSQQDAETGMKMKSYWETFFNAASGHLAGFGPNLNVTANIPETLKTFDIAITVAPNNIRLGKIQLLINHDGSLQDSFIAVAGKHHSMLEEGSFKCESASCTFLASAPSPVITTQGNAKIELTGSVDSLKGTIQILNAKLKDGRKALFELTAKLIK